MSFHTRHGTIQNFPLSHTLLLKTTIFAFFYNAITRSIQIFLLLSRWLSVSLHHDMYTKNWRSKSELSRKCEETRLTPEKASDANQIQKTLKKHMAIVKPKHIKRAFITHQTPDNISKHTYRPQYWIIIKAILRQRRQAYHGRVH